MATTTKHLVEPQRVAKLLDVLRAHEALHRDLLAVVQSKIDAMRNSQIEEMQRLGLREQTLVALIQQREAQRRSLLDEIGKDLGYTSNRIQSLSMSQLAPRLDQSSQPDEGHRAALSDATERLRSVMSQLARANRIAGAVSRGILNHLKWVFASVKLSREEANGYCGNGAHSVSRAATRIFDAVG